ncbi:DUF2971 domain-containing protein [Streptococcus cristatus]|uniref:DUF2971 domain-containing protein n=1 Tax=Streptococcus cristatus TaxID=45634 RepID=UPI001EF1E0D5|nr:DUF2971 domain-containing protein [Streptococcus cristatus]MCG7329631.1 DUF2971 domain-containing protein [Streptococcus cristatus]
MDKKEYNLEQNLKELEELISLYGQQPDEASCKAIVEKAESIYENYSDSEKLALGYAIALVILSTQQTELQEMEASVAKLQVLHQQFPDSPDIALRYAKILVNLSAEQTELKELAATVEKIQVLHQQFPDSPDIALEYAKILFNLSIEQTELKELAATVEKIQILHQQFPGSPDIAEVYATTLANLSDKQPEFKERAATAKKIQVLHQQFPDSPDIAEVYAMTLANLSDKQPELKERAATAKKLQVLHQQFPDSPDIAEMYAMTLFNLSTKQTELKELVTTDKKLKELHKHERFQKSEEIAFIYVMFLTSLFEHQTELSERLQATKIIKQLYEQFSTFMLQNFDDRFFSNDNVCDSEEYKLFNFILKEGLLKNTKYAIIQPWAEHYKEDSDELKNLLSIYQYVQKIKYQLGLKDEDKKENIKFGHYTKGNVLQILLDQDQREESSFSISGKTRLNNANYMNDPEEGIIIEKILGLDRRDALEPSSWFLMSFTIKTDDLAMWSQYGDDAKGVCIVLREDDFSRFSSFNDVSWRREKISLEFFDNMYLMKSELNSGLEKSIFRSESENSVDTVNDEGSESNSEEKDSVSKGNVDYLYRIAYVNDSGGEFSIEKTELFNDDEIKKLEEFLEALKEKIDKDLNKGDDFYQKAISDCIEEIRYLFKSVDYKYEDELRILRYANLDPTNEEIKIDKSSGIGKLYVERDNPIQIAEVIFGPKFANPEYVTPLLKLLDKDIAFKKSMIKFR